MNPKRGAETEELGQDATDATEPDEQDGYNEALAFIQEEQSLVNMAPDNQTKVRRSSRPTQIFTYENPGQPTLTAQATVNTANTSMYSPANTVSHTTQPLRSLIPYTYIFT